MKPKHLAWFLALFASQISSIIEAATITDNGISAELSDIDEQFVLSRLPGSVAPFQSRIFSTHS
ncbi:MAG: hypothetical protein O2971_13035 [Proteobacteria bacterium]|nr:hypothetical protein [Pseudomonadota bacterium]